MKTLILPVIVYLSELPMSCERHHNRLQGQRASRRSSQDGGDLTLKTIFSNMSEST